MSGTGLKPVFTLKHEAEAKVILLLASDPIFTLKLKLKYGGRGYTAVN
jgi:hypothetical protein